MSVAPALPPGQAAEIGLIMREVTKHFRRSDGSEVLAVEQASLAVERDSFVAVIGPSGCGKTTVLRLASGLLAPDKGQVALAGRPPVPGLGASFVFQSYRLIPWSSVRANVEFALLPLPLSRGERRDRVERYLALVGLARWAESYPGQLSGGMRQRVALARALASEPDLLLMDEPFASLDAQTRELMQIELMTIWAERRGMVLFVTHSVDEAILLADRIVLMARGRVLEVLEVGIKRPRWNAGIRAERTYIELRTYLWNRIRELVLSDPASDFYGRSAVARPGE
jgi:NitT/TauT family transport system ATP-binding protein